MNNQEVLQQKGNNPKNKILRAFSFIIGFFVVCAVFGFALLSFRSNQIWKKFDVDKIQGAGQTLQLYDKDEALIANITGLQNRFYVSIDQIPLNLKNAFIATEDLRFYSHSGVDIKRIIGAVVADIKSRSLDQGASTLTQQLVKLSHLTSEKTFTRKIDEALLSIELEKHFSKNEILEMYLNFVYFGAGAYGVQAASQEYFSKDVSELSLAQCATLAAIVKAPTHYAPHTNLENSIKRRNLVLSLMLENNFISQKEQETAFNETLLISTRSKQAYPYGFYTEFAMTQARELLGISQEELLSSGYKIYTALDPSLQLKCETLFLDDSLFPLPNAATAASKTKPDKIQAALVVIDPRNFKITTLLGARSHDVQFGLNRATQLRRQPGSAIKPIIAYAPALETFGYTAASIFSDTPTDFGGYQPKNFNDSYNGLVTMRQAITKSLNVPAVSLLSNIGVSSGKNFAQKVGITFDQGDSALALALGGFTYGITPLELCGAYSAFASGGMYENASCVVKITDSKNNILYTHATQATRVLSRANAFIMNSMLQSVIEQGTGKGANIGIPLAGKTGTTGLRETGGNKDAWMVAYNPNYVATLWMGYDNTDAAHSLPSSATGGTYNAIIIAKIFDSIYPQKDKAPNFLRPSDVVEVSLDSSSLFNRQQLMLSTSYTPRRNITTEFFASGTQPTQSVTRWYSPPYYSNNDDDEADNDDDDDNYSPSRTPHVRNANVSKDEKLQSSKPPASSSAKAAEKQTPLPSTKPKPSPTSSFETKKPQAFSTP